MRTRTRIKRAIDRVILPVFHLASRFVPPSGPADRQFAGDLPQLTTKPIIFAACDSVYFERFGASLVGSWQQNSPSLPLHLHVYSPTENTLAVLEGWTSYGNFSFSRATSPEYTSPERRFWCTADRIFVARRLLSQTSAGVFMVDVDTIIRGDLAPHLDQLTDADVALYLHDVYRGVAHMYVKATATFYRSTAGAEDFLLNACRLVAVREFLSKKLDRYIDQRVLFQARASAISRGSTTFRPLPFGLIDWRFGEASAIWTGKGKGKVSEEFVASQLVYSEGASSSSARA